MNEWLGFEEGMTPGRLPFQPVGPAIPLKATTYKQVNRLSSFFPDPDLMSPEISQ